MRYAFLVSATLLAFLCTGASQAADIPFNQKVSIKVGKSIVLKGVRGDCGQPAPSWAEVKKGLPKSKTGVFSDGGTGVTGSAHCGGSTPARAVKFTGKTKGQESFRLAGDTFSIKVQ